MRRVFRRRTLLAGAGAAPLVVAACADESPPPESEPGELIVGAAYVPVGSGVIAGEVVVTQPVVGNYQGFSAICTHAGCLLNEVVEQTIYCPCHGSRFDLDGAVVSGPAERPLRPIAVRLQGDSIVRG
ncbi:(2Fe-2S)-binding protein [Mycolicibacterium duvalii]|uniref:Cytochrome bc1 complex Rieske iron-sulfur subunit n=1 Tax=Mycolicibacterium duvalii TaxID=39688 RepID=A0A7I7K1J1_9MYCO|nr:Rieske (2Fe-2S) protein [Mycolicibacterium duvalii]MCV7366958.1 Rieske (2Fe-2S) protein [Mycolicibacterium duvalii]PEG36885.1 (2Fe-2S)-binding protein [Mycolicibacterium duvalii]BBX17925.1 hypothetical protein MDUV_27850 [Mycolicibacterium duvalii]